jgi:hypothetical protein
VSLAGTKLSKIKKLIAQVEKISNVEDPTLSFEFLIGSLYPEVYGNVQETIRYARTQGYIDASLDDYREDIQRDIKLNILNNEVESLGRLVDNVWEKVLEMAALVDSEKQKLSPTSTDKDEFFINLMLPRIVGIKKICDVAILELHLNEGTENGD